MSRQAQQQMIPVVRSQPQNQPQTKTVRAAAWSSPPASYSARDAAMAGAADPGAPTSVRFHYGRNRIALILSNALTPDDLQAILRSVFQLTEMVVGVFEPERQMIFPFSLLTKCPAVFTAEYYLVLERSGVAVPNAAASSSEQQRELIDSEGSDYSQSPSMSPASSSVYSSPAASPPRPQGRKQAQAQLQASSQALQPYDRVASQRAQQQRQPQQQQYRPSGAQQAYSKAQALARLAESSPMASSPDASEESDVNSSFDEADGDSQFSDYSERSDQKRDLAAEEAEFDRAVVRAMAAEKQGQSPFKKPQPRATTAPTRGQQQASAAVSRMQQQQKQQQQQSEAAEIALQERLLAELGGYDSNGNDGGVDGDVAEAMRQEFWQRERERHWIEAESKVLAAEAQKLAQQRQHIAELKRQQAVLQAEQAAALAAVQASAQQQTASRAAAQASSKVHAATALKSAVNGRASNARAADYNTFDPCDGSEQSDLEDSDEDGGSEVEQSAEESEDAGEEPVHPASNFPESFGLDARELQELDLLQHRAGFASVSPAQLMHLFSRRVDARHGILYLEGFEIATSEFILIAHGSSSSATAVSGREKAELVLRRLFDLFKEEALQSDPWVPFASFATGLSILCQGDRDAKMMLALSQFDPSGDSYISLDCLAGYLEAFFTVVLDLSVSLQSSVLRSVDLEELAYATAAKCWSDLGVDPSQPISFVQFRDLHLGSTEGGASASEGQVQQSEEEEEEEDDYESEVSRSC